ncbi:E3 ubiquitin-protein ligase AMFR [Zancudomyces culisetae]|uniref:E3 ubiquitin-protein ligase AMFR n=1 Tax=Zancudomyces culisetae TaxID=1213189 RepID=A0A1R1PI48_ZANCU|nr:E3 ubiquitin-protein ligase AMFR [Zancudomyces culisetae]|eukprot:OMH80627.1 E3 ubiquitin-protein ligase AMFR [Zancudomyces culisetae]
MKKGVRLPCGHLFHRFCLRKWLERHPLCPLCRSTLKSCDGYSKLWQDIRKSPHYGADLLFSPTPGGLSDQRHNFINRT